MDLKKYINIEFQNGPVLENGINGCQIEDVIDVLLERLMGFQETEYVCRENSLAITKLQEAKFWLYERTRNRIERGVEGKNIP